MTLYRNGEENFQQIKGILSEKPFGASLIVSDKCRHIFKQDLLSFSSLGSVVGNK
jgi:hypothetical protein